MYSQTQKQENSSMIQRKPSNHKRKNKKGKERNKKKYKINWKTRFKAAMNTYSSIVFVQSLRHFRLFGILWTAAHQASLSFTISWSLLKLMSIESVMPSNYLILCCPLLLLPLIFHSIRVFSNELALHIRWPK